MDQINRKQFETHWIQGELSKVDYYSKHHTSTHHKKTLSKYFLGIMRKTSTHLLKKLNKVNNNNF